MIESFKNSFLVFLKNPFVLIPALVSAITAFFLSGFVSWSMLETVYEFAIQHKGMQLGLFEMITVFYHLYAVKLLFFFIVFFALSVLSTLLLFFYSKYAMHFSEKNVFIPSIKYALSRTPSVIALTVFALLSFFLAGFFLFAIILFVPMDFALNTILFLFFAIIFFIAFLKLYLFVVPAMVLDDSSMRKGLTKSWNFTTKTI